MARFKLNSGKSLADLGARLFDLGLAFKKARPDVQKAVVLRDGPSGNTGDREDYAEIICAQVEVLNLIDEPNSEVDGIPVEIRFVFDHFEDSNDKAVRVVHVAVPDFTNYDKDSGFLPIDEKKLTEVAREAMGFVSIMGCTN